MIFLGPVGVYREVGGRTMQAIEFERRRQAACFLVPILPSGYSAVRTRAGDSVQTGEKFDE